VKAKRPGPIKNLDIVTHDLQSVKEGAYTLISIDMWTFLKTWYEADYKVRVTPHQEVEVSAKIPFDLQS